MPNEIRIEPRKGSGIFYAVGTFNGKRIRESLKTRDRERAQEQCALHQAGLWKRLNYGEAAVRTFEEAAVSYIEQGGEKRFLAPIIKHFKGRVIGSIAPGEIRAMALKLYPAARTVVSKKGKVRVVTVGPAARNRQAIVPARAVITHGHSLGWCPKISVELFEVPKSRKHKPVDRAWLDAFLAQSDADKLPHLSALVLYMNQTAARVSEAIRLEGQEVDLGRRLSVLEKTKTDDDSVRHLTTELVVRLASLGLKAGERVFSYTDPKAVNRRISAVCKRAGIPYRSTHSAGRHSFGTNAMDGGAKVKDAMDAGGWKSAKLFMETYVHSTEAGRAVAEMFDAKSGPIAAIQPQDVKRKRNRFGKSTL